MADTATLSFGNSSLDSYYQSILKSIPNQTIERAPVSLQDRSIESITEQVRSILQPKYQDAVRQRQVQTKQNQAAIDADAASRGMGASTWVTDSKGRQLASEATDVASLGSNYMSSLAEQVAGQYENHLNRKASVDELNANNQIEVDKWNSQVRTAAEALAYQRALEAYKRASAGSGGGSSYVQKRSGTRSTSSTDGVVVSNPTEPTSWFFPATKPFAAGIVQNYHRNQATDRAIGATGRADRKK